MERPSSRVPPTRRLALLVIGRLAIEDHVLDPAHDPNPVARALRRPSRCAAKDPLNVARLAPTDVAVVDIVDPHLGGGAPSDNMDDAPSEDMSVLDLRAGAQQLSPHGDHQTASAAVPALAHYEHQVPLLAGPDPDELRLGGVGLLGAHDIRGV